MKEFLTQKGFHLVTIVDGSAVGQSAVPLTLANVALDAVVASADEKIVAAVVVVFVAVAAVTGVVVIVDAVTVAVVVAYSAAVFVEASVV